jgi:hypothetical protein
MGPRAALLALAAGCYSPRVPQGVPCESTLDCPSPQRCVLHACSVHDAPEPDAAVPIDAAEIDAAPIDAPPDAPPLACTAAGLTCAGTATTFLCGGHCWVHCATGATWPAASQACTAWMGALGEIDDDTEQSCVAAHVNTATWVGLVQGDATTAPAQGWSWNTPARPVVYTHWESGKPDDRDGSENHEEQCAKIQTDGTWDDVACSAMTGFLCER